MLEEPSAGASGSFVRANLMGFIPQQELTLLSWAAHTPEDCPGVFSAAPHLSGTYSGTRYRVSPTNRPSTGQLVTSCRVSEPGRPKPLLIPSFAAISSGFTPLPLSWMTSADFLCAVGT